MVEHNVLYIVPNVENFMAPTLKELKTAQIIGVKTEFLTQYEQDNTLSYYDDARTLSRTYLSGIEIHPQLTGNTFETISEENLPWELDDEDEEPTWKVGDSATVYPATKTSGIANYDGTLTFTFDTDYNQDALQDLFGDHPETGYLVVKHTTESKEESPVSNHPIVSLDWDDIRLAYPQIAEVYEEGQDGADQFTNDVRRYADNERTHQAWHRINDSQPPSVTIDKDALVEAATDLATALGIDIDELADWEKALLFPNQDDNKEEPF